MKLYSPLRYPGGKNKLAKFIGLICEENQINGHYIEPYAGGASVALHLLMNKYVKKITINDYDRSIYAFWYSIFNYTERFCKKIEKTEINVDNWKKFKKIQKNKTKASLFQLGFSTFFLNRTNHSGIIDGGIIGGLKQDGLYKINCRFNKENLIKRIKLISKFKSQIVVSNLDALALIKPLQKLKKESNSIVYFDPPYYFHGPSLYMNHYKPEDHKKVAAEIAKIKGTSWIVSYDKIPQIKELYKNYRSKEYSFLHTARNIRMGKEILFFSDNLVIPRIADPINFDISYSIYKQGNTHEFSLC